MTALPLVILAGGLGTRMREETEFRPKPMVEIGGKPMMWHIMKYYSTWGVSEFVICTGYKGEYIKNYFLNYQVNQCDVTINLGADKSLEIHGGDVDNWKITIVDTGPLTPTGGRILRIKDYINSENFYCTYGDGIANVNIEALTNFHYQNKSIATLTAVRPTTRFGVVDLDDYDQVVGFREKPKTDSWVNGGYFVFNKLIFDYLSDTVPLETEPLQNLASQKSLSAFKHEEFWQPVDTIREAQMLSDMWNGGNADWDRWTERKFR